MVYSYYITVNLRLVIPIHDPGVPGVPVLPAVAFVRYCGGDALQDKQLPADCAQVRHGYAHSEAHKYNCLITTSYIWTILHRSSLNITSCGIPTLFESWVSR